MLQRIRDKSSGWIAFVILGLVIITMAFFGIESYFAPKVETFSAKIEGPAKFWIWGKQSREISQDEFRRRFEQVRVQERNRQGESFDSAAFESMDIKRQVLDAMVDQELLALVAERDGITVGEAEVAEELKATPEFQVNGAYSADQYRLALAAQGLSHAQFMARACAATWPSARSRARSSIPRWPATPSSRPSCA
ncbi:SurA N-terminal domain-containing protein [Arenimonas daejeonensis]|uniref:SurA N-terminal domain-containing protein n=1 Tax=Arenimonas daejeonensis TaxID=370777 RepID=UPI0011BF11E6|nr:SurA N-terminal domain-containing protein [Arenimonas daejeonensis]